MNPHRPYCSSIASPTGRVRRVILGVAGVAASAFVTDVAAATDLRAQPAVDTGVPCAVDVSDWPLGILPDDASAAFGPSALTACTHAVADWPLGVVPDDAWSLFDHAHAAT